MANRKVPDAHKRVIANFSIRRDVRATFKQICAKNGVSGSRIVENMLIKYNEENGQ